MWLIWSGCWASPCCAGPRDTSARPKWARATSRALHAILEEIEQLNAEIGAVDPTPRGKLKITAPPAVGNEVIAPLAVDFVEAYPEIELEIDLSERLVDLVAEGFDAAIRAGPLENSSMIAHRIVELRYLICASPSYLERRGVPMRPEDIGDHDCIYWRAATGGGTWSFFKNGERVTVSIRRRLVISSLRPSARATLRGLGLAILPLLSVREDLEVGATRFGVVGLRSLSRRIEPRAPAHAVRAAQAPGLHRLHHRGLARAGALRSTVI